MVKLPAKNNNGSEGTNISHWFDKTLENGSEQKKKLVLQKKKCSEQKSRINIKHTSML